MTCSLGMTDLTMKAGHVRREILPWDRFPSKATKPLTGRRGRPGRRRSRPFPCICDWQPDALAKGGKEATLAGQSAAVRETLVNAAALAWPIEVKR